MSTTTAEIQVFAMFPLDGPAEHPNWDWVHCLTFPLDTLNNLQFSTKQYKWIRYVTGVVVGAQGDFSFSRDSPNDIIDYEQGPPYESADLYYHISHAEKEKMFPADPDMERTTISSSNDTSRRMDFRDDVIERDGTCVVTNYNSHLCDAVHLLPHSKANAYIETYTRHRSRGDGDTDVVHDIDDVRNGILLNKISHVPLGKDIAFLMSPNFAMTTTDVDPTAPPTEKRCTAHLFTPHEPECLGNPALRSGHLVRMPDTTDEWPPDILFDAVYANAVLHHFSTQTMRNTLGQCKSKFYPGKMTTAAQANYQSLINERASKAERKHDQDHARSERAAKRAKHLDDDCDDFYDCLLILPYLMVPPDKREEFQRKAAEKRAERERSRVEDKVVGWARDVANACP